MALLLSVARAPCPSLSSQDQAPMGRMPVRWKPSAPELNPMPHAQHVKACNSPSENRWGFGSAIIGVPFGNALGSTSTP